MLRDSSRGPAFAQRLAVVKPVKPSISHSGFRTYTMCLKMQRSVGAIRAAAAASKRARGGTSQIVIRQRLRVLQLLPHLGHERLHLLQGPPQYLRQRKHGKAIQRQIDVQAIVLAHALQQRVSRPSANRHLPHLMLDVEESGFLNILLHLPVARNLEHPPRLLAGRPEKLTPSLEDVVGVVRYAGILGPRLQVDFHALDPPAGLESRKRLPVKPLPVVDPAEEVAHVDKVEDALAKCPVQLSIVDLERTVGRQPGRLHSRDVGANDLGGGKLVGHVDGPDAGAGADIEDLLGVFERRGVELVVVDHEGVVVGDVIAFEVLGVLRGPVLGGVGALVGAAVDGAVFVDAGSEGGGGVAEAVLGVV